MKFQAHNPDNQIVRTGLTCLFDDESAINYLQWSRIPHIEKLSGTLKFSLSLVINQKCNDMGIKSFQGRRAKQVAKNDDGDILVTDYMTRKLVTFSPKQSILEVMELFTKYNISGGPVLDDNGFLVGIISEADCMKQISESRYFNQPILDKSVEKYMTKNVETIPHDISIFDAAGIFDKHNRRRLPVMKKGLLVGQISRKDIVIAALKLSGQNYK